MEVVTIMEVDTILEVEVAKIRYLHPEINKQICALLKNGIYLDNKVLQTLANVASIMDAFIDEINWYFIVRCPFSD